MKLFEVSHPGVHGVEKIEAEDGLDAAKAFRGDHGRIHTNHDYVVRDVESGKIEQVTCATVRHAEEHAAEDKAERAARAAEKKEAERVANVAEEKQVAADKAAKAAADKAAKAAADKAAKAAADKAAKAAADKAAEAAKRKEVTRKARIAAEEKVEEKVAAEKPDKKKGKPA